MLNVHSLFLSILCTFYCQISSISGNYSYLPHGKNSLHINLLKNVTFDRKIFGDIWIYKNGLVTIGSPLENENYPNSMDNLVQPFENIAGSNIIAVFIMEYQMLSDSLVRVRQNSIKSIDSTNKKLIKLIELKIKEVHGELVISPFESIVEIEWIEMKPVGVDDNKKNTFRLLMLSTIRQTFCVIHYMKVESSIYQLNKKIYPYQSGLSSYSDMKYVLPTYNVTRKDNLLQHSSNIELENFWVLTMGDTSYYIDFGWPTQNHINYLSNSRDHHTIKLQEEFRRNIKNEHQKYRLSYENSKTLKSSTKSLKYFSNKNAINKNILFKKTLKNKRIFKKGIKNTEPLINFTSNGNKKHLKSSSVTPIEKSWKVEKENTRTTDYPSTHYISTTRENSDKIKTSSSVDDSTKQTKRSVNNESNSKHLLNFNTISHINVPTNQSMRDQGFVTWNPELKMPCSHMLCRLNEECFIFNDKTCCKCRRGTNLRENKCIKNDDPFQSKSQGIARMSSIGIQWNFDLTLFISKGSSVTENFPRAHITLAYNDDLSLEIRNFLLLLYPVFHIPMAFYASTWNNETIENMNSLVEKMAGMHIYLAVGQYDQIYISFRLDRQANDDVWNISLNGINIKNLKDLKLNNLRFDEKSSDSFNLMYNLVNSNSIEFPEQTVLFQDESNSKQITIKWRGTMSFAATCLSNYIVNKKYYVKFSDKSYCNSDCYPESETKKTCRVMCLSSPHVFDRVPKPCEGNFCGDNRICVNFQNRYECKCNDEMIEFEDKCINGNYLSSTDYSVSTTDYSVSTTNYSVSSTDYSVSTTDYSMSRNSRIIKECENCSINANCISINSIECCSCKIRYMGSGINCWEKDSQFELRMSGTVNIIESTSKYNARKIINLFFRQYASESSLHFASFLGIDQFSYSTIQDQQFFQFILLLAPLYDIPLALFARGKNQSEMGNIYALSKGQVKIEIEIESTVFNPINVIMEFSEKSDHVQMFLKVIGIPAELDSNWLIDSYEHFSTRGIGVLKYSIEANRIIFDKHKIKLPDKIKTFEMSWKGHGELHKCAHYVPKRNFMVVSSNQYDCNPKCQDQICKPYCQAITELHELSTEQPCLPSCASNEQCIKGTCICNPGYSRKNSHCAPIKKDLECRTSNDCFKKRFMECRDKRCVCLVGYEFRNNECVIEDACRFCETNELCANNNCLCKPEFVRNRISKKCLFDCSLCDPYSTNCIDNRCSCQTGFLPKYNDRKSCDLLCQTDNDCPTFEKCTSLKICHCPYEKHNGICQQINGCDSCHRTALCQDNNCKCHKEWIGDGINCTYNCSLCFDKNYCSSKTGCLCPPKFKGNGKFCDQTDCLERCPENSVCIRENDKFICKCTKGNFKVNDKCVKDTVELNIIPHGSQLEVNEGETVELFCVGSAKFVKFELFWLRNSGKQLNGQLEYADSTRTTLKLSLKVMKVDQSDTYICGAEASESKSINIQVNKVPIIEQGVIIPKCKDQCSNFARCENGHCRCLENYVGDGIYCCSRSCSSSQICNKTSGKCHCRSGFINYKFKCVKDCRKFQHCDGNAKCNLINGLCECRKHFIGNGTTCWKQTNNCLLTRRCASNATCKIIEDVQQHLCLCDSGFVGDGILSCYKQIDCNNHKCGRNSFCEPFMVQNQFGNQILNGKCTCNLGYFLINNNCTMKKESSITLWMSMGEAIISHKIGQNLSLIQYIEIAKSNEVIGIITSIVGDCARNRLIWAADNGRNIKSANINNFSNVSLYLSNLGKIMGIAIDENTGNVYFSDSYRGKIGLLNLDKNISRTLISMENYSPGPLVVHHKFKKIFWIVNDYQNPRIEVAELNGQNHKVFVTLNMKAISLTIAFEKNSYDRLCWVEVNKDIQLFQKYTIGPIFGIIKCTNINIKNQSTKPVIIHKIHQEEPFSALVYIEKQFYWNVQNGAFLKTDESTERKLNINPNCCDVRISSLTALTNVCHTKNSSVNNPCYFSQDQPKCPELCVPIFNNTTVTQAICLNKDK